MKDCRLGNLALKAVQTGARLIFPPSVLMFVSNLTCQGLNPRHRRVSKCSRKRTRERELFWKKAATAARATVLAEGDCTGKEHGNFCLREDVLAEFRIEKHNSLFIRKLHHLPT